MDIVNHLFEGFDLSDLHLALAILGLLLAATLMHLSLHGCVAERADYPLVQWGQRATYVAVGLALMWSVSYANEHAWQPWPPHLMFILVCDLKMIVSLLQVWSRTKPRYLRRLADLAWRQSLRDGHSQAPLA